MQYVDLEWKNVKGLHMDVRVYVCAPLTQMGMRRGMTEFMKKSGWKIKLNRNCSAHCVIFKEGDIVRYLIGLHGISPERRISCFAHEALHLVEDFFKGRAIPRPSQHSREEHKCILLDRLVHWFVSKERKDENYFVAGATEKESA